MTPETEPFEGYACVRLQGERSTLHVTVSAGPRIIGLSGRGHNVMAVVPDATLERPGGAPFRLMGGHRLWASPEVPEITYEPDERPCSVSSIADGVRVEAPADGAGLVKALEIRAAGEDWIVDHELRNASASALTVAAWAITQLRSGGRAVLPLGDRVPGYQADRSLVLWPYTDLDDPRLAFEGDGVAVQAVPGDGPVKVGAAPGRGWVSYTFDDEVFEKRVEVDPSRPYPDRGAAVQVFARDDFCELETLGPLVTLGADEATTHRETWTLREAST
ncbi:MAG TPA: hypothetical protein VFK59_04330 [Actinomycetota bacterium]|nr:hypothetical protein [Actinomycetota bacterium]